LITGRAVVATCTGHCRIPTSNFCRCTYGADANAQTVFDRNADLFVFHVRIFNQTVLLLVNKQLSFVTPSILDDLSLFEVIPAFHTLVR
jgi:hypothetical protein